MRFGRLEEAHARQFPSFPAECGHVIAELALVYHHDAIAARWNMTPTARLALHRGQSGPVMARLWTWMEEMLASGDAEENSGLGQAIKYMRRHWQGLTAFLEIEGAPIANDLVERALKWAIQYRKNSLQYRTANGALVGDIMMNVIRTTIAAARNPVDYLTTLLRNAAAVATAPELWLPFFGGPHTILLPSSCRVRAGIRGEAADPQNLRGSTGAAPRGRRR